MAQLTGANMPMPQVKQTLDSQMQKALDIEYHRHAAASYDYDVTRAFHFFHVWSLTPWARDLLRDFPAARVLDLGTGTGAVACLVAQLGCRVDGIDHSQDMLEQAGKQAAERRVTDRVRFRIGDCEKLDVPDESYEAVTIQGVLHHLTDMAPTLREAWRVLKPGGHLYISEPCRESNVASGALKVLLWPGSFLKRRVFRRGHLPQVSEHEAPVAGPELTRLVQSLGFRAEVEYLVRTGLVRFFPESWRIYITLLFSMPTRRRRGDIMFIKGVKPVAQASSL